MAPIKRALREMALFAGAGGEILGGKLLGWETVCAVEINAFCARRLMQRQNEGHLSPFPIWDDVSTFDGRPWRGCVDVVSGGFPCQPFSTAHRGRPDDSKRLWHFMERIVCDVEPRYVFAENVSHEAIILASRSLRTLGYSTRSTFLYAADLGADHLRKRYWLFAYSDNKGQLLSEIDAEMGGLSCFRPRVWDSFTDESGVADGMADRMDRFKAIGNGQIPAMAELAWKILTGER